MLTNNALYVITLSCYFTNNRYKDIPVARLAQSRTLEEAIESIKIPISGYVSQQLSICFQSSNQDRLKKCLYLAYFVHLHNSKSKDIKALKSNSVPSDIVDSLLSKFTECSGEGKSVKYRLSPKSKDKL